MLKFFKRISEYISQFSFRSLVGISESWAVLFVSRLCITFNNSGRSICLNEKFSAYCIWVFIILMLQGKRWKEWFIFQLKGFFSKIKKVYKFTSFCFTSFCLRCRLFWRPFTIGGHLWHKVAWKSLAWWQSKCLEPLKMPNSWIVLSSSSKAYYSWFYTNWWADHIVATKWDFWRDSKR